MENDALKGELMSSHNIDLEERDLSEAPRLAKETTPRSLIIGGCVAVALFLALLAYGSLPALSPQEIVAMDGYEGEQPTRHIFNIQSLEEADDDEAVAKAAGTDQPDLDQPKLIQPELAKQEMTPKEIAPAETAPVEIVKSDTTVETDKVDTESPVVVTTRIEPEVVPPVQPATVETVQVQPTEPVQPTQQPLADAPQEPAEAPQELAEAPQELAEAPQELAEAPQELAEAPQELTEAPQEEVVKSEQPADPVVTTVATLTDSSASTLGAVEGKKVVAAMATTPTIDEAADTVVIASVAAIEPVPVPAGGSGSKGKLLPLRSVLADSTELKASPTSQSKTLLSLGRGVVVTAFERHGEWIHIGTNDGSSITGFVLESSLGKVDTKNSG